MYDSDVAGQVKAESEAVDKLMNDFIVPTYKYLDCSKWRFDCLYNEACDTILKRYVPILQAIYKQYSVSPPGKTRYLGVDEFTKIVTDAGVVDDSFGAREISPLFNLSMMTQVDELSSEKFSQMIMVEFIEAISRVADKLALSSHYEVKCLSEARSRR